eukprot:CAMPEP_0185184128 /NCGR_PEP_ID=MMETSP1140-20130426/2398_1 /TAXON_ID=298111 /ORGANISM="Pavlova sp., Strain CCMP459" /LENGTH=127 /DNA_ID=CAMNT_0027750183 /DNA_START=675 /DNA_END=1058 /DNA_ORIENTATION=-
MRIIVPLSVLLVRDVLCKFMGIHIVQALPSHLLHESVDVVSLGRASGNELAELPAFLLELLLLHVPHGAPVQGDGVVPCGWGPAADHLTSLGLTCLDATGIAAAQLALEPGPTFVIGNFTRGPRDVT